MKVVKGEEKSNQRSKVRGHTAGEPHCMNISEERGMKEGGKWSSLIEEALNIFLHKVALREHKYLSQTHKHTVLALDRCLIVKGECKKEAR